ncbi:MAG: prefoldin subunit beta [Candidatus Thermoplasmatota archaeon]
MAEEDMSKQLQDQISRLQQLRSQLQTIMQQKQQVEMNLREISQALEELDKTEEKTPIYRSVGSVLIKAKNKKEIIDDLESNKESLDLRKNTLEKQEGRTKEKLSELQSKVQNSLSMQQGGGGAAGGGAVKSS